MTGHTNIVYDPATTGAWKFGKYRLTWPRMGKGGEAEADPFDQKRVHAFTYALQEMLAVQGFYLEAFNGVFDYETHEAVKHFQRDVMGERARDRDGQVGRSEMEHLCARRLHRMAEKHGVPPEAVAGLIYWESGWDPCAVGYLHPQDWGLGQFNMDVGDAFHQIGFMAFDPQMAIPEVTKRMGIRFKSFLGETDGDEVLALNCAVAAHNSPVDAQSWADNGTPPDEQIATYVARILNQYPDGYPA